MVKTKVFTLAAYGQNGEDLQGETEEFDDELDKSLNEEEFNKKFLRFSEKVKEDYVNSGEGMDVKIRYKAYARDPITNKPILKDGKPYLVIKEDIARGSDNPSWRRKVMNHAEFEFEGNIKDYILEDDELMEKLEQLRKEYSDTLKEAISRQEAKIKETEEAYKKIKAERKTLADLKSEYSKLSNEKTPRKSRSKKVEGET